eukprot:gene19256-28230_t
MHLYVQTQTRRITIKVKPSSTIDQVFVAIVNQGVTLPRGGRLSFSPPHHGNWDTIDMDPEPMWLEPGKQHTISDYYPWITEWSELRLAPRPPARMDPTVLNATTRVDMHAVMAHLSEARGDTKDFFEDALCHADPALLKDRAFM